MNTLIMFLVLLVLMMQVFLTLIMLKTSEDISYLYNLIRVENDFILEEINK